MAAAPGTASRPRPYEKPMSNLTTNSTLSKLIALDLANPAGLRSETPNDLESLGSFKRGSLFVTNGAPSPVPSSPDMRAASWGSQQKRSPSLPNLPSLANLPALTLEDTPPLPKIKPITDDRFIIPRKPVGSSRNVSGGTMRSVSGGSYNTITASTLPARLDMLTRIPDQEVRMVSRSPVRSVKSFVYDSASDYDANGKDISDSEDEDNKPMEFVASVKPLPRRTSAAKISIKDRPSSSASRSAASPATTPLAKPTVNPIDQFAIPEKSARRSMDATTPIKTAPPTMPQPSTPHASYNTFANLVVHDHPSPELERQAEMKVLLPMNIVVGTVAETVPDRSRTPSLDMLVPAPLTIRKSSQPSSPGIPVTTPREESINYEEAITITTEALEANARASLHPDTAQRDPIGADSGYSSSESYMVPPPKSWRRSKSINAQNNDADDGAIVDVVEIDQSEHSAAEEPSRPQRPPMAVMTYSSTSDKSSPKIQEPSTPKKSRGFFSRKSFSEKTPEASSPNSEEPKKIKKSRRLSFRRLGSKANKEELMQSDVEMPSVHAVDLTAIPNVPSPSAVKDDMVPQTPLTMRTEKAEPKSAQLSVARSISTLDLDTISRNNEAKLSQSPSTQNHVDRNDERNTTVTMIKRKSVPSISNSVDHADVPDTAVPYEPMAVTSFDQARPIHALKTGSSVSYTGSAYYQRFSTPSPGPSAISNLANQASPRVLNSAHHHTQSLSAYNPQSDISYNPEPQYIQDNHDYSRTSSEIARPTVPDRKRPQSYTTGQGVYTPPRPKSIVHASTYQDVLPYYGSSPPLRSATKSPPSSYKFNTMETPTPTPPMRPKTSGSRPSSYYGSNTGAPPAFALEGGAYPRMSRESQNWGVDFADIPVLRAEDLVQGYGSTNGIKSAPVYDSDEDEQPSSRSRQKTSFWSRRSRSKSKPRMAI